MLKQSTSVVFDLREAYLVKHRWFPDSFGRFTFDISPFTNDKAGLFEHPAWGERGHSELALALPHLEVFLIAR